MTAGQAMAEVDKLWPNSYDTDQKLRWLSRCESQIYTEIIELYGDSAGSFDGFHDSDGISYAFVAGEPYDQLYIYWLEAMMHYADGEINKYNNAMSVFNTLLQAFLKWYGRQHGGRSDSGRFLF